VGLQQAVVGVVSSTIVSWHDHVAVPALACRQPALPLTFAVCAPL
jgi:hypothetical protein